MCVIYRPYIHFFFLNEVTRQTAFPAKNTTGISLQASWSMPYIMSPSFFLGLTQFKEKVAIQNIQLISHFHRTHAFSHCLTKHSNELRLLKTVFRCSYVLLIQKTFSLSIQLNCTLNDHHTSLTQSALERFPPIQKDINAYKIEPIFLSTTNQYSI